MTQKPQKYIKIHLKLFYFIFMNTVEFLDNKKKCFNLYWCN
jgi:hypothetical protein